MKRGSRKNYSDDEENVFSPEKWVHAYFTSCFSLSTLLPCLTLVLHFQRYYTAVSSGHHLCNPCVFPKLEFATVEGPYCTSGRMSLVYRSYCNLICCVNNIFANLMLSGCRRLQSACRRRALLLRPVSRSPSLWMMMRTLATGTVHKDVYMQTQVEECFSPHAVALGVSVVLRPTHNGA